MKFEDMIANSMLQVLNSKEHASLFKKAYKEESSAASDSSASSKSSVSKKDSDNSWVNDANDAKDKKHKCNSCGRDENNCMCGDKMYAKDGHKCHSCKQDMDKCMCGDKMYADDNEVSDMSSASSKHSMALNVALESLLKASAALDYCGLSKGSELAVKVATLVSEAKKGKVDLTGKREESAKKHLRKLRELAEEESSLPKGRGESKSTKSTKTDSKKPVSKKKVSKASKISNAGDPFAIFTSKDLEELELLHRDFMSELIDLENQNKIEEVADIQVDNTGTRKLGRYLNYFKDLDNMKSEHTLGGTKRCVETLKSIDDPVYDRLTLALNRIHNFIRDKHKEFMERRKKVQRQMWQYGREQKAKNKFNF